EAFDVSDEAIRICKERMVFNRLSNISFFVAPFEELSLPENAYDAVVGACILHHVDIPAAVAKIHSLLKPEGLGVFLEPKESLGIERIRSLPFMLRKFPLGGKHSYATEHERKLSKQDLEVITSVFPDTRLEYWLLFAGRVRYFSPALYDRLCRMDYLL